MFSAQIIFPESLGGGTSAVIAGTAVNLAQ